MCAQPCTHMCTAMHAAQTHPHHPAQTLIVSLSVPHPGVLLRGTRVQTGPPPLPRHRQPARLLGAHQWVPNGESSGLIEPHHGEGCSGNPDWPWGPCSWSPGSPTGLRARAGVKDGGMEDREGED